MSSIPLISLEELESRCLKRDFEILKISLDLDKKKLFHQYQNTKSHYDFKEKDKDPLYKGISLHYSNDEEPLYDGLNQVIYMKPNGQNEYYQDGMRLFHKKNKIADGFGWLFTKLPFHMFRGRLLESHPGHRLAEHSDGPIRLTLHVPLTSHPDNLFYLNKKSYHLEDDGCAYVINTSFQHWIENRSEEVRAHLIFNISRMSFWPLSPFYLDQLDQHYAQIGHQGFDALMHKLRAKMLARSHCDSCEKQQSLFPVVRDFSALKNATDQETFQLLCQPCTRSIMNARKDLEVL